MRLTQRRRAETLAALGPRRSFLRMIAGAGMFGTAPPIRVPLREGVELPRHFDEGPGHRGIAAIVLALVGVDVPVVAPREGRERLIGAAIPALDGQVANV